MQPVGLPPKPERRRSQVKRFNDFVNKLPMAAHNMLPQIRSSEDDPTTYRSINARIRISEAQKQSSQRGQKSKLNTFGDRNHLEAQSDARTDAVTFSSNQTEEDPDSYEYGLKYEDKVKRYKAKVRSFQDMKKKLNSL